MTVVDLYGLTPVQAGILFHAETDPRQSAYLNHLQFELHGPVDPDRLAEAFRWVFDRHEILRTSYHWAEADEPLAAVHDSVDWRPAVHDLRDDPEPSSRLHGIVAERLATPMDLARPGLMRLDLIRLAARHTHVLWTHHHLILDGWSLATVFGEAIRYYRALCGGPAYRPDKPVPFRQHVAWLRGRDPAATEAYWRAELAGAVPTRLAVPRVGAGRTGYGRRACTLPPGHAAALAELARSQRVTLAAVAQAAWALVLQRYSGSDDVLFGTTVSGRPAGVPGVESMVGMFINTVPVRVRADPRGPASGLLRRLLAAQAGRSAHEHAALTDIARYAGLAAGDQLFDTLLVVENFPLGAAAGALDAELDMRPVRVDEHTHYPLTVTVLPGRELVIELDYRRDVIDDRIAAGMLGLFTRVLDRLTDRPSAQVGTLAGQPYTPVGTLTGQPYTPMGALAGQPVSGTVVDLFLDQAARDPDAAAAVSGAGTLSYAELDRRSAALAGWLAATGTRPGDAVALRLGGGHDLATAVLGVLRAGAGYLPLDPELPPARAGELARRAGASRWLDAGTVRDALGAAATAPAAPAGTAMPGSAVAYTIFTSGSTGTPKGVLVPHSALAAHARAVIAGYGLGRTDRVLQFASPGFDVAAEEMFPTWAAGGAVVFGQDRMPGTVAEFCRLLDTAGVTVVNLPAAYWHLWVDELTRTPLPPRLRLLIVGDEPVWRAQLSRWRLRAGDQVAVLNAYGTTETTITTTVYRPGAEPPGTEMLPIGTPLVGMVVRVLDHRARPVPQGVIGELYVGGSGVATGYLDDPAGTAERFIPDPWPARPGARLYRTGDLGYRLPGGDLVLTGRADDQVQIRGHRVEPAEVEAVLAGHPAVGRVAVVARGGHPDEPPYLVAHLVPRQPADPAVLPAVAGYAAGLLPEYLRPSRWLIATDLPLLPNGKVDRATLAGRPDPAPATRQAAPATATEQWVTDTWRDVLGVPVPARDANFFALGGHSLSATQVTGRIQRAFGVRLPLPRVLAAATPAELARAIDQQRHAAAGQALPPLVPAGPAAEPVLSYVQERMWFLDQLGTDSGAYSMPAAWRLDGGLDAAALRRALAGIVARHAVLRSSYPARDGLPVVRIRDRVPVDLVESSCPDDESALRSVLSDEAHHPFDLATGPLFRFRLLRLAPHRRVLVINLHHIVFDGWSYALFMAELADGYRTELAAVPAGDPDRAGTAITGTAPAGGTDRDGTALAGGPDQDGTTLADQDGTAHASRGTGRDRLPVQYTDYARWQRGWLHGAALDRLIGFWRTELAGLPEQLDLPTDRPRARLARYAGGQHYFTVPDQVAAGLRAVARDGDATLFVVLLAGFCALLHRHTGQNDLAVGTPVAGRLVPETERLIGCFVNTLPLRSRLHAGMSFTDLVESLRRTCYAALEHQEAPFEKIVEAVTVGRRLDLPPLVQVMFLYQNTPHRPLELAGVAATALAVPEAAKLDMTLTMAEQDGRVAGVWEYNQALFDTSTARRLCDALVVLLADAAGRPDTPVASLAVHTPAELAWQLGAGTGAPARGCTTALPDRLRARVAATPHAPAVICGDDVFSYADLHARTDALAARLRELGIRRGDLVGICVRQDTDLPVAMWGVLKAGAGYVPLDPTAPPLRLAGICADAGVSLIVASPALVGTVAGLPVPVLPLPPDGHPGTGAPRIAPAPDDLAYVLFTSGSTGRPKGVAVTHGNVANHLDWLVRTHRPGPADRALGHHRASFDLSVPELYLPLVTGGTLVLADPDERADPAHLLARIRRHRVTMLAATPSMLRLLAADRGLAGCPSLRLIISCGETLPAELAREVVAQTPAVLENHYGPTETTVSVTRWPAVRGHDGGTVPIGNPLDGCTVRVVDAAGRLAPPGAVGELYVGGAQVARGYQRSPSLTAERFVPDPYAAAPGARRYRTGDLGRMRPDGTLEHLGRVDRQVKVRGHRIEPGEVEAVLAGYPGVRQAAVLATGDRLVAFVAPGTAPVDALIGYAAGRLPPYLLPARVIGLPELPRTANQKIDYAALLTLGQATPAPGAGPAPAPGTEAEVAAILAEVLGLPVLGARDDFFVLGGQSLLAAQAIARLRRHFGVDLPLRLLFAAPTVAGLAAEIEATILRETDEASLLAALLEAEGQVRDGPRGTRGTAAAGDGAGSTTARGARPSAADGAAAATAEHQEET